MEGKEARKVSGGIREEKLTEQWLQVVDALEKEDNIKIQNPGGALEGALSIRCVFADDRICSIRHPRLGQSASEDVPRTWNEEARG